MSTTAAASSAARTSAASNSSANSSSASRISSSITSTSSSAAQTTSSPASSATSSTSSGTSNAATTSGSSSAVSSASSAVSTSSTSSSTATSSSRSSRSAAVSSTSRKSSVSPTITKGSIISANGTSSSTKSGLSSGAIGGIVGGIVGVLALLVVAWYIRKWRIRRRDKVMYPLPPPRSDMAYLGGAVTKEDRPGLATSKSYGSYNALYAPPLPSYYPNYNRRISSFQQGLDLEASPTAPQAPYMISTTNSSPSITSQNLQSTPPSSSTALNAAVGQSENMRTSVSGRPLPAPIQTEGLAPPVSVMELGRTDISRKSSRSTMLFPHMPLSPSMTSMHSNGFGNTPHSGRRITLTMPAPLDPKTSLDGYMPHSRTNSISEFGQYTSMYYGGGSPVSTMKSRGARDSRRSLQPYHHGHFAPHFPTSAEEISDLPGGPVSDLKIQHSNSISTTTAPSNGPSRSGSGSAGSTNGSGASDSEALMISTAKGKQVDRS